MTARASGCIDSSYLDPSCLDARTNALPTGAARLPPGCSHHDRGAGPPVKVPAPPRCLRLHPRLDGELWQGEGARGGAELLPGCRVCVGTSVRPMRPSLGLIRGPRQKQSTCATWSASVHMTATCAGACHAGGQQAEREACSSYASSTPGSFCTLAAHATRFDPTGQAGAPAQQVLRGVAAPR